MRWRGGHIVVCDELWLAPRHRSRLYPHADHEFVLRLFQESNLRLLLRLDVYFWRVNLIAWMAVRTSVWWLDRCRSSWSNLFEMWIVALVTPLRVMNASDMLLLRSIELLHLISVAAQHLLQRARL